MPTDVDSEIRKIAHWSRSFCAVLFLPSKPPVVIMRLLSAEKKDKNEKIEKKKTDIAQQLSYIPQMEQHLYFRLMLFHLGMEVLYACMHVMYG